MRLRTSTLMTLGAAASAAGALGFLTFGGTPVVGSAPPSATYRAEVTPRLVSVTTIVASPRPRLERFAFVSPAAHASLILAPAPVPAIPPLRGTIERDIVNSWATETRPAEIHREPPAPTLPAPEISAWTSPSTLPRTLPRARPRIHDYALARRLAQIAPGASKRVIARFNAAKIAWPPAEVGLVSIKDEKVIQMFARDEANKWKLVHRYKVLAASGGSGPKLRQGDKQVPEGIYSISYLNPHSRYHVSLRVNYPNAFDRKMAAQDGRKDLGGDIMIHGKASSIGCLAVGDDASEEIFWLAAEIGIRNMRVIIAPTDFRRHGVPAIEAGRPGWLPKLYAEVAAAMSEYPAPPPQVARPVGLVSFFGN